MGGSLSDQLLKMGLVSKKQAKKAAHGQRKSNKKKGRAGVEADRSERQAAVRAKEQQQRDAQREQAKARQSRTDAKAQVDRLKQLVSSGRLSGKTDGRRRFYVETRTDRVVFLQISDSVQEDLERGRAAIVESPRGQLSLVTADAARRVRDIDPSWIRLFAG